MPTLHPGSRILDGKKAFTLIEVLVVISIIVFLISMVTLSGTRARARARDSRRVADLNTIRDALVLHLSLYGSYPALGPCQYNTSTAEDPNCPDWLQTLVDRKLLSAVPRDPVNRADLPVGIRLVESAYAFHAPPIATFAPTLVPPGPIPSATSPPEPTATLVPPGPIPSATFSPTPPGATPTPSPTAVIGPAPGSTGRQYAIYAGSWSPIADLMLQNNAQMILCASKMEIDKRETLENGYPNPALAASLIAVGYNPASRCLLLT